MHINLSNGCTVGLKPRFNVAMLFDERIQPFFADIFIETEFRSQLQLVLVWAANMAAVKSTQKPKLIANLTYGGILKLL